jgi:ribose 5-phosphate isomerase B
MHTLDEATGLVERFLTTPFSGDPRHVRRIAMMSHYEESAELPELPAPPPLQ